MKTLLISLALLMGVECYGSTTLGGPTLNSVGGSGSGSATNAIGLVNGFGTNTTLVNATITSGTINGNGGGLTNLNAGNIASASTNTIYYIDPTAINAIGVPNNPLFPYRYCDSINTAAMPPGSATLLLEPGINYMSLAISNQSVISYGDEARTLLVCTNTSVAGIDGQSYEQAIFYIGTVSNLTFANFTVGAIPGGIYDLTNYVALFYGAVETTISSNIKIRNVDYPFSLASYGIPTGGASLDGGYIRSTNATLQFDIRNLTQDVPWDCWMSYNGGTNLFTFNDCNFNSRQIFVTNALGNTGGTGHCISFQNPGNGSVIKIINSSLATDSTTNQGFPLVLKETSVTTGSNLVCEMLNDTITNASASGDIELSASGSILNYTNGFSLNISGGIYDESLFFLPLGYPSFFANGVSFNYNDWLGNSYNSGVYNGNGSNLLLAPNTPTAGYVLSATDSTGTNHSWIVQSGGGGGGNVNSNTATTFTALGANNLYVTNNLSVSNTLAVLGTQTNTGTMLVAGTETNYSTFVDIGNSFFTGNQSVGTEINTNLDVQNPNGGVVGAVLTMTSSSTGAAAWSNSIAVSGSITAGTTISAPNLATNGTPNTVGGLITMPTTNCFESTNNLVGMTNLTTLDSLYIPMGAGITSNIVSGNITAATPVDITNNGDGWSFLNGVSNAFYVRLAMPVGWNLGTIQVMTRAYTQITNGIGTLATNACFSFSAGAINNNTLETNLTAQLGTAVTITNRLSPFPYKSTYALTGPITVGNSPAQLSDILLYVERLGAAASGDTVTNPVIMSDFEVIYTKYTFTNSIPASP